MDKHPIRFKVMICNIIISVLCLVSIVSYFIFPFFKIDVALTLTAETLSTMLSPDSSSSGNGNSPTNANESGETGDAASMLENVDWNDVLGPDGITIAINIELKTADILSTNKENAAVNVQKIIDDNVNKIIDSLDEPLNKLVKGMVKTVAKVTVKETVKESVKESIKESLQMQDGDPELQTKVEEAMQTVGLTDEYIDEKIDEFIEILYQEDATVDSATNAIVNVLDTVISDIVDNATENNVEGLDGMEKLTEDQKTELADGLREMLSTFADENGNIDMDNVISQLMLQMMQQSEGEGEGAGNEEGGVEVSVCALGVTYMNDESSSTQSSDDNLNQEEQDAKEQLKAEIRNMISDMIPAETAEMIAEVMQIISYVIYFTFFTWIWLIFKILMKCRRHCNGIKLKLPIWLGWLPYLILGLIPNAAMSMLKDPAFLAEMGASADAMGGIMSSLNISFFNCGVVSFYIAIFLLLFGLFYYGRQRRKLKKEVKRAKKEARAAKKAAKNGEA